MWLRKFFNNKNFPIYGSLGKKISRLASYFVEENVDPKCTSIEKAYNATVPLQDTANAIVPPH